MMSLLTAVLITLIVMTAVSNPLSAIILLRAKYQIVNIIVGIFINLILIYAVLKSSERLEDRIGPGGLAVLRKIFDIILLAIAVKLFKTNLIPGF